eukprot:COSAG05_NODE_1534_length_4616_cov_6.656409_2_plen_63_part_00
MSFGSWGDDVAPFPIETADLWPPPATILHPTLHRCGNLHKITSAQCMEYLFWLMLFLYCVLA